VPIPGASAVTTALSASGLPADRYLFLGFVPRKGGERSRMLARAAAEEWSVVFFESPARLGALLEDLRALAGPDRPAVVARELTKIHEEFRGGTLAELADYYSTREVRGEVTLVLAGTGTAPPPPDRSDDARALATRLLAEGVSRRQAARQVATEIGLPRNEAYRLVMEL
jgi:16S rRNA (cytidine1402-2'-O)-methyltransferase